MLGKIEGKRKKGQQRMRWLDNIPDSMDLNLSKLQETVVDRVGWQAIVYGVSSSAFQVRVHSVLMTLRRRVPW